MIRQTNKLLSILSDYGPLTRTIDPNLCKEQINALIPYDGGDAPKMCLSGL